MISILGIIKVHKLAAFIAGGVIATSGVAGATFAVLNSHEPTPEPQVSQITSDTPNTTTPSNQSTITTDTIDAQEPTKPVDMVPDQGNIAQSVPAQPSAAEILAEKCAEIDARYNRILDDGELLREEWIKFRATLTNEERDDYPQQHGSYRGKLIRDMLAEREQAGCPTN